jgi:hypothetical protein
MSELSASEKIAAVLLLHRRELSTGDIRALPFVETDDDILEVVDTLSGFFPLETTRRKIINASGIPVWEDVLQLR